MTFRPYDPDQMLLMPPALRDWLPEGHLAHHVSDPVDGQDLGAFYAPYEGDGRRKLLDHKSVTAEKRLPNCQFTLMGFAFPFIIHPVNSTG